MKIVIDISEKQYKWITDCEIIPEILKEELIDAIRAGKPLEDALDAAVLRGYTAGYKERIRREESGVYE